MDSRLFDRAVDEDNGSFSRFLPLLRELEMRSRDEEEEAMLANLHADWRVSPERAAEFAKVDFGTSAPRTAKEWIDTYFEDNVRATPDPDFLAGHNRSNRRVEIVPSTRLVQIFRITGLFPEVIGHVVDGMKTMPAAFLSGPYIDRAGEARAWMLKVLTALFPPAAPVKPPQPLTDLQTQFLDALWNLLDRNSPDFHPNWVGLAEEFEPYQVHGPEVWLSLFGKPVPPEPCLCLVLSYTANDVPRPLLSPTVIDSGWWGPHFPNPPRTCAWRSTLRERPAGGHPVSFWNETPPLLQEFIHPNAKKETRWVTDWGWTSRDSNCKNVANARADHLSLLSGSYDGVREWMQGS